MEFLYIIKQVSISDVTNSSYEKIIFIADSFFISRTQYAIDKIENPTKEMKK
jgi:HD superfamily phosphohydrolase YqeK